MTNVFSTPEKVATRQGLFDLAVSTLEADGWEVSRVPRVGKSSIRKIDRGKESHLVSIRTSQDGWIAFPRKQKGEGWVTLDEVDFVIAASVDDKVNPKEARVHMVPGDDARKHFDRAYAARKAADYTLPAGRGMWISLYDVESRDPVSLVGAGLGLKYPPIARRPLNEITASPAAPTSADFDRLEMPLTIGEAKERLAASLGVPIEAIKIVVEH